MSDVIKNPDMLVFINIINNLEKQQVKEHNTEAIGNLDTQFPLRGGQIFLEITRSLPSPNSFTDGKVNLGIAWCGKDSSSSIYFPETYFHVNIRRRTVSQRSSLYHVSIQFCPEEMLLLWENSMDIRYFTFILSL